MKLPRMFVCTLAELPERKRQAQEHFGKSGLRVQFVDGYHAQSMGLKTVIPYMDDVPDGGKPWYIGQGSIGNILSHNLILRMERDFIKDEEFIIFEDDARVPRNFPDLFAEVRRQVPPDWGAVHLEHCCTEGKPIQIVAPRVAFVQYPLCTAAILVRRRAVQALLDATREIWAPIDICYAKRAYALGKVKPYCAWPKIVTQLTQGGGGMPSTIQREYIGK